MIKFNALFLFLDISHIPPLIFIKCMCINIFLDIELINVYLYVNYASISIFKDYNNGLDKNFIFIYSHFGGLVVLFKVDWG